MRGEYREFEEEGLIRRPREQVKVGVVDPSSPFTEYYQKRFVAEALAEDSFVDWIEPSVLFKTIRNHLIVKRAYHSVSLGKQDDFLPRAQIIRNARQMGTYIPGYEITLYGEYSNPFGALKDRLEINFDEELRRIEVVLSIGRRELRVMFEEEGRLSYFRAGGMREIDGVTLSKEEVEQLLKDGEFRYFNNGLEYLFRVRKDGIVEMKSIRKAQDVDAKESKSDLVEIASIIDKEEIVWEMVDPRTLKGEEAFVYYPLDWDRRWMELDYKKLFKMKWAQGVDLTDISRDEEEIEDL